MKSKILGFLLILAVMLTVSCGSSPKTESAAPQKAQQATGTFDPKSVSRAQHDATLDEVQRFIVSLNDIINKKNYSAWKSALSQNYYNEISSPQFLKEVSDSPAMKARNIALKTPEDYFTNVVVPSRANSRVDDIEFIGTNRVKAFTVKNAGEARQVLYDLEKIGNSWLIVN